MATRKTSTRGKTKTAKKPSTKKVNARKTTTAVATRKRATTKKTVAKANVTSRSAAPNGVAKQLRTLAALTAILSLVTAGLAAFFMNQTSYQFVTTLQTKDELLSKSSTVLVPAVRAVVDVELRWLVVTIMVLGAVIPLLILTRMKDRYVNGLKAKNSSLRWLDTAVISALLVETIALLSGVNDIMVLKLIAGLVVTSVALSYITERQNVAAAKPSQTTYYLSLFTGALPWLMIAVAAIGTFVYGGVRAPWYVYALYVTTLIGAIGCAINQSRQMRGLNDYQVAERNYLQLSLFTRLAFGLLLVIGLMK